MENIFEIVHFTDPMCPLCWGSEPVLKKIKSVYGPSVIIKNIMGGMVRDVRNFYNYGEEKDFPSINKKMTEHWQKNSEFHGMPVSTQPLKLFTEQSPGSVSHSIAVKSAQMQGFDLGNKYYRRMQEATMVEGRETYKLDVQIELAEEVGLDIGYFVLSIKDQTAGEAYLADTKLLKKYNIDSFPSYLLTNGKTEVIMKGFHTFDSFEKMIDQHMGLEIQKNEYLGTIGEIKDYIKAFESLAPRELEEVFPLGKDEIDWTVKKLEEEDFLRTVPAGNSYFIKAKETYLYSF